MAQKFSRIKEESGSEYLGSIKGTGRAYTGFLERFSNAFGTPNYTGHQHVCFLPRVVASRLTLGRLPVCDVYGFGGQAPACVVVWGCNITELGGIDGMCGGIVRKAIGNAEKVIVIDPRRIGPAEKAACWLQLRPGTDGALALAMLHVIIEEDLVDHAFVDNYTSGFDELTEHVKPFSPEWAAGITRLNADDIRLAARTYATTKPACIQWGNALDMSACNFHTARSILFLMAITGNIDRPGGDVLWVSPEKVRPGPPFINPFLMGNEFLPLDKKKRMIGVGTYPVAPQVHPPAFWRSIITGDPYRLRALWILGANPLLTMTHSLEIEKALGLLEYVVVSDIFLTPTAQHADLVLPASTWLEQDDVVDMLKGWCAIARKKVAQVGEARFDRDVIIELGRRMGFTEAFPWADYRAYLEWALQDTGMDFDEFCEKDILIGEMRYEKYRTEGFQTPSGKFEIYSNTLKSMGVCPLPVYREASLTPVSAPELYGNYPLLLTSAKAKEFFHTEGRQIAPLRRKNPDPLVQIHPDTAMSLGVVDGDWVWIETPLARVKLRATLFDGVAPDVVVAQYGWWFPEKEAPDYGWKESSLNLLFGDVEYDKETGSESLRGSLCRIYPVNIEASRGAPDPRA
jgi:anaerobic selenocysteine-containing dehydrogenase